MKKGILVSLLLAGLFTSLFAADTEKGPYKFCGDKIALGQKFEGNGWLKFKYSTLGGNYLTYEKSSKNDSCKVIAEATTNRVVSIAKKFKTNEPIIPGKTLFGADFKSGSFYGKSNMAGTEVSFTDPVYDSYFRGVKEHLPKTKTMNAIYDSDKYTVRDDVMCMAYGAKCIAVFTLRSKEIDRMISPLGTANSKPYKVKRPVPTNLKSYSTPPMTKPIQPN